LHTQISGKHSPGTTDNGLQLACSEISIYALCVKCSRQLPEVFIKYGICTAWKIEQSESSREGNGLLLPNTLFTSIIFLSIFLSANRHDIRAKFGTARFKCSFYFF
jgi:hypothetical protein